VAAVEANIAALREVVRDCTLCPQHCHVDRTAGEVGFCGVGAGAVVASAGAHFGEEPVLVGAGGSGTIFFSGCNLRCVFCQNWDISHDTPGTRTEAERLAETALRLQRGGCENVNFVTPTHVSHVVAAGVHAARQRGLTVPIVYNCGGYESVETLRLLEGLVQIYMPDFKYADASAGAKYSHAADYPQVATVALAEMHRQVGPLVTDARGVATRGVLVRHLVMPDGVARGREVIDIVAETAPGCAVNVMGQYRPAYRARESPELDARASMDEVRSLREYATRKGLRRVD
jgi:putative pyruvate formate lyase activating enzyme